MPEKGHGLVGNLGDHVECVVVAVGAGKHQDPEFHTFRLTAPSRCKCNFLVTWLPQAGYGKIVEDSVGADQGQTFQERLCRQHPVEWILVLINGRARQPRVFKRDG